MSDEDKNVPEQDENAQQEVSDNEIDSTKENEVEETPEEETEEVEEKKDDEHKSFQMSVSKAQKEKEKAVEKAKVEAKAEAEAEMAKLREEYEEKLKSVQQSKTSDDDYRKELEEVAKEHGLDPAAADKLLKVFQKSIKVPDLSKYDKILKEREFEAYKSKLSKDFDTKVVDLIKKDYPSVSDSKLRDIKDKVIELAVSKDSGYVNYKLEDIYRVRKDEFEVKNGFSAETSSGHSAELISFDKPLSDNEEHQLAESDPKKYQEYVKYMTGKHSRYLD